MLPEVRPGVRDPGHEWLRSPWDVLICSKHVCKFVAEPEKSTHGMALRTDRCSRLPLAFARLPWRRSPTRILLSKRILVD